jgi:hypothetical protein
MIKKWTEEQFTQERVTCALIVISNKGPEEHTCQNYFPFNKNKKIPFRVAVFVIKARFRKVPLLYPRQLQ